MYSVSRQISDVKRQTKVNPGISNQYCEWCRMEQTHIRNSILTNNRNKDCEWWSTYVLNPTPANEHCEWCEWSQQKSHLTPVTASKNKPCECYERSELSQSHQSTQKQPISRSRLSIVKSISSFLCFLVSEQSFAIFSMIEKPPRCDMTERRGRNDRGNQKQKKKKRKLEDAD